MACQSLCTVLFRKAYFLKFYVTCPMGHLEEHPARISSVAVFLPIDVDLGEGGMKTVVIERKSGLEFRVGVVHIVPVFFRQPFDGVSLDGHTMCGCQIEYEGCHGPHFRFSQGRAFAFRYLEVVAAVMVFGKYPAHPLGFQLFGSLYPLACPDRQAHATDHYQHCD